MCMYCLVPSVLTESLTENTDQYIALIILLLNDKISVIEQSFHNYITMIKSLKAGLHYSFLFNLTNFKLQIEHHRIPKNPIYQII